MFQLTKDELEFIRSQLTCSNIENTSEQQSWMSHFATSNFASKGLRKLPYAFTENGVAMLSSVLRSPLAIQVNIGIMRVFTEIQRLTVSLSLPGIATEIGKLRKDFNDLKLDIEDILRDQNDINESTRAQLDAISLALAELQAPTSVVLPTHSIGYIRPKDEGEK